MSKTGVNWLIVYDIFIVAHVLIGLVNNSGFRSWFVEFLTITLIFAIIMAMDRNI